jgi:cyclopropane-fatty-acyl-phospholipid synthase
MSRLQLAEQGWLPDSVIRFGIRRLLDKRLEGEGRYDELIMHRRREEALAMMQDSPVAVATEEANEQHYELPPAFFARVLGQHMKYSSCFWHEDTSDLSEAELAMLDIYAQRAELADGQQVLELGCGWGSLSLYMARRFPNSRITAVSNSASQKAYIDSVAQAEGLRNLLVITADVNAFSTDQRFDRVVTVEMLEHVRNYAQLFQRIALWMRPDALMFAHIFCHEQLLYPFEVAGQEDWMAKYFFTGGMMPSYDTFTEFQQDLSLQQCWRVDGVHYQRTADAWLDNMDQHQHELIPILKTVYGETEHKLWWQRWRMFFMACSELFGYAEGKEWMVGHYVWHKQ